MKVSVEKLGTETVQVPAGHFSATQYRSERFGATYHWIDDKGTVIRWASEDNMYRWELDSYPSSDILPRDTEMFARGDYEAFSPPGGPHGVVPWSLETDRNGAIRIFTEERIDRRNSCFEGLLDPEGHWKSSSESSRWTALEGDAEPETHHFEHFFFGKKIYLVRFRPRAYPFLQSQPAGEAPLFHAVNYPIVAASWLRQLALDPGRPQRLPAFSHIANRFRGSFLELQEATATYLGTLKFDGPHGSVPAHHFTLRYPGGYVDSTFEYWADVHFIPLRVKMTAGEGAIDYKLTRYELAFDKAPALFKQKHPVTL